MSHKHFSLFSLAYIAFSLISILVSILLTPPGQVVDEMPHFARAAFLAEGKVVGRRLSPVASGGLLPCNFNLVYLDFERPPSKRIEPGKPNTFTDRPWNEELCFVGFPNTVIYAPFTYIPAALTIWGARHTHMTIIQTGYAVRIMNGFISVLLCAAGIVLARRGVLFLAAIASMPMTITLAGSCSQDGILIGLTVLAAGILTRFNRFTEINLRNWIFLSILFALLAVSKPPLLMCSMIPVAFMFRKHKFLAPLPVILSVISVGFWSKIAIKPVKIQFLPDAGVSDGEQVHWVMTHLLSVPDLLAHTIKNNIFTYLTEWIGVLGWLDAPLPHLFYYFTSVFVFCTLILSACPFQKGKVVAQERGVTITTLFCTLAASAAVFLALYIIWTKVGDPIVNGVQGRYFLPIAPFLALVFPQLKQGEPIASSPVVNQTVIIAFCAYWIVDAVTIMNVLFVRYW
ncbi:MAG: DUF2142 domain-containing protein [Acetobacter aceti]|uniref:DUF2142 domain-containing protein n=1 Tax=Acetobacter aceti TaxID=435 RepID=A0A1U9KET5_ACEAC|nr:DUF2142 domain-containing protein [Acetobacter aceti]AQS84321.1 hypothetical protein A0U92_05510 [Acetobacter aceti]